MGGDLSPRRLLRAYTSGIFPWFDAEQPILWWAPNPRMVLLAGQFHASRSFKKRLRTTPFTLTVNQHFDEVIAACAAPRKQEQGTWIIPAMQAAYGELHRLGVAHSVEVLLEEQLVGGLYGVAIGRAFFGESMFSRVADASKTAFAALAVQLNAGLLELVDCQVSNPHLSQLGAKEISRSDFETLLISAITEQREWLDIAHKVDPSDWPKRSPSEWLVTLPSCALTVLGAL